MKTLTIKELAPYLPYELKIDSNGFEEIRIMSEDIENNLKVVNIGACIRRQYKPLLRPLSDLKDFKLYEFTEYFYSRFNMDSWGEYMGDIPYSDMEKLFENHFDVFGLIEKGLAIDLNTIKETVK